MQDTLRQESTVSKKISETDVTDFISEKLTKEAEQGHKKLVDQVRFTLMSKLLTYLQLEQDRQLFYTHLGQVMVDDHNRNAAEGGRTTGLLNVDTNYYY